MLQSEEATYWAGIAYEAFCGAIGWETSPPFDKLSEAAQSGWAAAAYAVKHECLGGEY